MIKTVALALTACAALLLTGCGSESRTGACGMACCADAKVDCAACPACKPAAAKPACAACEACAMPESATAAPVK